MQHDYFSTLDQLNSLFMALSLPFSSLMLKLPHVRNEEIYDRTGRVPFPNQLKPARSDSWAIVYGANGKLISKYALYHLTHRKPRSGGRKVLFREYTAKLINPENHSGNTNIGAGSQSLKAHGGQSSRER